MDDDELRFPASVLREWKETAEHMAAVEARGFAVRRSSPFPGLERKAPVLIAEMRTDLSERPLVRELILLKKGWGILGELRSSFTISMTTPIFLVL